MVHIGDDEVRGQLTAAPLCLWWCRKPAALWQNLLKNCVRVRKYDDKSAARTDYVPIPAPTQPRRGSLPPRPSPSLLLLLLLCIHVLVLLDADGLKLLPLFPISSRHLHLHHLHLLLSPDVPTKWTVCTSLNPTAAAAAAAVLFSLPTSRLRCCYSGCGAAHQHPEPPLLPPLRTPRCLWGCNYPTLTCDGARSCIWSPLLSASLLRRLLLFLPILFPLSSIISSDTLWAICRLEELIARRFILRHLSDCTLGSWLHRRTRRPVEQSRGGSTVKKASAGTL